MENLKNHGFKAYNWTPMCTVVPFCVFSTMLATAAERRSLQSMNMSNLAQQGLWETLQGLRLLCRYCSFWKARMNLKSMISLQIWCFIKVKEQITTCYNLQVPVPVAGKGSMSDYMIAENICHYPFSGCHCCNNNALRVPVMFPLKLLHGYYYKCSLVDFKLVKCSSREHGEGWGVRVCFLKKYITF